MSQALTAPRKAEDIARGVGVSPATVHRVIADANREGVAGIETPGKGGRRRQYLTLEPERAFLQPFLTRAGRGASTTPAEIQLAWEAHRGQAVNTSPLDRLLDRHGWRPRPVPAQGKEETDARPDTVPAPERRTQAALPQSGRDERSRPGSPRDRSEQEWAMREPLIPLAKPGGRPRTVPLREGINALRSVDRTGCPWRALPHDVPPWPTVWTSLRTWRNDGPGEDIPTV